MEKKLIELLNISNALEGAGYQLMFAKTANNNLVLSISLNSEIIKNLYLEMNFNEIAEEQYKEFIKFSKNLIMEAIAC